MILPSREMGDDQGQALSIADMESCEALPEDELLTFGENSSQECIKLCTSAMARLRPGNQVT